MRAREWNNSLPEAKLPELFCPSLTPMLGSWVLNGNCRLGTRADSAVTLPCAHCSLLYSPLPPSSLQIMPMGMICLAPAYTGVCHPYLQRASSKKNKHVLKAPEYNSTTCIFFLVRFLSVEFYRWKNWHSEKFSQAPEGPQLMRAEQGLSPGACGRGPFPCPELLPKGQSWAPRQQIHD